MKKLNKIEIALIFAMAFLGGALIALVYIISTTNFKFL
jgi:hypothetical protein